jgi:hypothetical protein
MPFNPQGLAWGQGRVWVLDTNGNQVVRIQP